MAKLGSWELDARSQKISWSPELYRMFGLDPEVEDFYDRSEGGIYDGATDYGRREYYNIPAPRSFLLSFRLTF